MENTQGEVPAPKDGAGSQASALLSQFLQNKVLRGDPIVGEDAKRYCKMDKIC